MIFVRSFLTESIVVIRRIFPIRPTKIKTNASIAPINVISRVGRLDKWSDNKVVELIFREKLFDGIIVIPFIFIYSKTKTSDFLFFILKIIISYLIRKIKEVYKQFYNEVNVSIFL